jgi:hypothetical protein
MSSIYEAVRASIKSKIPAEKVVEDQVVDTNRDEILNLVPFHVKRAINSLQNRSVIPPKSTAIPVTDKEPFINKNGERLYEFVRLPDDFSEIEDFNSDTVEDDWDYWANVSNIDRMSQLKGKPLFKVERINITDQVDEFIPVLVLSPFPDDGYLYISYKFKADEKYIATLDDSYWNAVITAVEKNLNIGNERDADNEAYELSRKWRQPKQRSKNRIKNDGSMSLGYRRNRLR